MKISIFLFTIFTVFASCNKKLNEKNIESLHNGQIKIMDTKLAQTMDSIKNSDIFENPKNWEARGLMPSGQSVILILRKATDDFLRKLENIYVTSESPDSKLKKVREIVDELPWNELDTEEKEFLADTLSPALKAAGFDPSRVF